MSRERRSILTPVLLVLGASCGGGGGGGGGIGSGEDPPGDDPGFPVQSLGDLRPDARSEASADPGELSVLHGRAYFAATDSRRGRELWVTDGTSDGTQLHADLNPGVLSSSLDEFAVFDGRLFFSAGDPGAGRELWESDGTPAGERRVVDLEPGPGSSLPRSLTPGEQKLFFIATTSELGSELACYDGRDVRVFDLEPGPQSSHPSRLTALGDLLYFRAERIGEGSELWVSDGTAGGTQLVADLYPGPDSSSPSDLIVSAGRLFFAAEAPNVGRELWTLKPGDPDPTLLDLWPGAPSSDPTDLVPFLDGILFAAHDAVLGTEPFFSDGTDAVVIADIHDQGSSFPGSIEVFGDRAIFVASTSATDRERQLWRTDGSDTGTFALTDLESAPVLRDSAVLDRRLYFRLDTEEFGSELWVTDATVGGTQLVADLHPGRDGAAPAELTPLGEQLLFAASTAAGRELWSLIPGRAPEPLTDAASTIGDSDPVFLSEAQGVVQFAARGDADVGRDLWTWDGRRSRSTELFPGADSSSPGTAFEFGDALYLAANGPGVGRELWRLDDAGTQLLDLASGQPSAFPDDLVEFEGNLYLLARDDLGTPGLWKSDGTLAGTELVRSFQSCDELTVAGSRLFLVADDGVHGRELWRSDGTNAGTAVIDIDLNGDSRPQLADGAGRAAVVLRLRRNRRAPDVALGRRACRHHAADRRARRVPHLPGHCQRSAVRQHVHRADRSGAVDQRRHARRDASGDRPARRSREFDRS